MPSTRTRRRPKASPEETFHFLALRFNVTEAKLLCAERPDTVQSVNVKAIAPWMNFITVDKKYAMTDKVNCKDPIILAMVGQNIIPIDGCHRVFKAMQTGKRKLKAYILSPDETKRCSLIKPAAYNRIARSLSEAQ